MAYSALKSPQGFHKWANAPEDFIVLLPGDPGVTYVRGDLVNVDGSTAGKGGCLIEAADSMALTIGTVEKSIVCSAATQAFPIPVPGMGISDLDGAAAKCLIPVRLHVPAGETIYRGTFANHKDETVVSYTASTRAVALTTGLVADHYGEGAIAYVYEGPGKGEVNILEDYDHADGAAELLAIFHRPFNATLTSSSKMIILANAGATFDGIPPTGGRMDLDEEDAFDASDGGGCDAGTPADGDFVTVMCWTQLGEMMRDLTVLAVRAGAFW